MPASLRNEILSHNFSTISAEIGTLGLDAVYKDVGAVDINYFANQLGGTATIFAPSNNLYPPVVVVNLNPSGYAVFITGFRTALQSLAYLSASGTISYTHCTGSVNIFAKNAYDTFFSAVLTHMGAAVSGQVDMPVTFYGHSFGGVLTQLMINNIKKDYNSKFSIRASYIYGSPKAGTQTFCDAIDDVPLFNVRNLEDFVCSVPTDGLVRLTNVEAGNHPTGMLISGSIYGTAGQPVDIGYGSVVYRNSFDNPYNTTELMQNAFRLFDLGIPHTIESYWSSLNALQRGQVRERINADQRAAMAAIRGEGVQGSHTIQIIPQGQLPVVIPSGDMPTPPVGTTLVPQQAIVRVRAGAVQVPIDSRGRSQRAGKHDGRVKKVMGRIIRYIEEIERHDARAAWKNNAGTIVLRRPNVWGDAEEEALTTIYNFLQENVNLV